MKENKNLVEITYLNLKEDQELEKIIQEVALNCFKEENIDDTNLYLSVTLTNPENIRKINKEYRNIDKETDVLSFPMFEKEELEELLQKKENIVEDVLGDIIISMEKVVEQSKEYGHSIKRELAYMVVHGFYHLMGYDHMKEEEKQEMRKKEENILNKLNITR